MMRSCSFALHWPLRLRSCLAAPRPAGRSCPRDQTAGRGQDKSKQRQADPFRRQTRRDRVSADMPASRHALRAAQTTRTNLDPPPAQPQDHCTGRPGRDRTDQRPPYPPARSERSQTGVPPSDLKPGPPAAFVPHFADGPPASRSATRTRRAALRVAGTAPQSLRRSRPRSAPGPAQPQRGPRPKPRAPLMRLRRFSRGESSGGIGGPKTNKATSHRKRNPASGGPAGGPLAGVEPPPRKLGGMPPGEPPPPLPAPCAGLKVSFPS